MTPRSPTATKFPLSGKKCAVGEFRAPMAMFFPVGRAAGAGED